MMIIDMTTQLAPLITGMNAVLVFAASSIVAAAWHGRPSAGPSQRVASNQTKHVAIVDTVPSAPAMAGEAPSDTSVPEAA